MPPSLRKRPPLHRPSQDITRASGKRFSNFPDLQSCWEQSKEHQKYFLKYLDCSEKKRYHEHKNACKLFDDMIVHYSTEQYKKSFFLHYIINGRLPRSTTYLNGLITDKTLLSRYASCSLQKKQRSMYQNQAEIPNVHEEWPVNFNLFDIHFSDRDRTDALEATEMCIERRILFRNACVKACCTEIDTRSHDQFLLILQILRAQLIDYA